MVGENLALVLHLALGKGRRMTSTLKNLYAKMLKIYSDSGIAKITGSDSVFICRRGACRRKLLNGFCSSSDFVLKSKTLHHIIKLINSKGNFR